MSRPMTNPDSLQAICAELREGRADLVMPPFYNALADRLERLDAEMRKDEQWEADASGELYAQYHQIVGLETEIADLRARLAACETHIRIIHSAWHEKIAIGSRIDSAFAALATQPTPDPNPSPSSQPYDAEGATVEHDPAKAKAPCLICHKMVHMDDADEHCASHRETAPPQ